MVDQKAPGAVRQITSLTNPIVKDIRALAMKKAREETGQFVGEGLKLVTDAVGETVAQVNEGQCYGERPIDLTVEQGDLSSP